MNETAKNHIERESAQHPEQNGGGEQEISMDELLKSEEEFSRKLYEKEIVQVKIVQLTEDNVLVDIGEKKEAVIPLSDFDQEKTPPPIGSKIVAVLEKRGGEGRHAVLSHKKAQERLAWEWCLQMFNEKARIKGRVLEAVKGGYIVDAGGMKAFMPLSLSELGGAHKHYLPLNAKIKIYIIDIAERGRKIIVSRRQVLEEDEKERKVKVLSKIREGEIVRGVVSKAIEEGIFVRFQGIEGFVRIPDLAWRNPEEALKRHKRGQRVKCKIIRIDREQEKLTLGIKQTTPNPLDLLKKKFPFKSVVRLRVVSVSKEGAKVSVDGKTGGSIQACDFGHEGIPRENATIHAAVVGYNPATFELNLSIKRFEEIEDRKKVKEYLKDSPNLTLGQILLEDSEDDPATQ
ncbi:MAG: S1 RNA-binding domain-containing protein [Elusimicrobia bacterium]|nr:S1 RNA-binding domain-containing protein [Elusimicrobiota bacterium]